MRRRPFPYMLYLGSSLVLASVSVRVMAQDSGQASSDSDDTQVTARETRATTADTLPSLEGSVAERQSIDAFTSLEDGQPGDPWSFEFQFDIGWESASDEHDPVLFDPELKFTLGGNDFLRNTKLTLTAPTAFGIGGVEGNADIEFGWQQRWITEEGWIPTFATLAEGAVCRPAITLPAWMER